jgi:ATP-dependent Clp protease ATP-binding subunit ClpC
MFERFTEHARHVMALANREAQLFGHEYICSEHILWGLAKEVDGVAAAVLAHFDVNLKPLRAEVETLLGKRPHLDAVEKQPPSSHAKEVVTFAIEEARSLGNNYIGTEHLLLGMMRDVEMVSAAVLANLGLEINAVRDEVRRLAPPTHDASRG